METNSSQPLYNTSPKLRFNPTKIIIFILFLLLGLVILMPYYWMVNGSTLSGAQLSESPPRLYPGTSLVVNIQNLFREVPYGLAYLNSIMVAGSVTIAQLFFCSLAGFAFATYPFPGRNKLFGLMLATMMIPGTLNLIPIYIMMAKFHWLNTLRALIIPGMVSAFGIFWMRQSFAASVPDEVIHSARIDGCSEFGIYYQIALPIVTPALGILGLLTFLGAWNDYIMPLIVLSTPEKFTLPLLLNLLNSQKREFLGALIAGSMLSTIPSLLLLVVASRQLIQGIALGAVKT
jgi:cellobiose transport system permease protein